MNHSKFTNRGGLLQLLLVLLLVFRSRTNGLIIKPEVPVEILMTAGNTTQVPRTTTRSPPPSCPWSCEITSKSSSCGRLWKPVKKIVGGKRTVRNTWPWMVAIWNEGQLSCGGTLICSSWVLTAAHCFLNKYEKEIDLSRSRTLYLGRYIKNGKHKTVRIFNITKEMVTIHAGYHIQNKINDIAMIRLPKPVKTTRKIRPICLPEFGRSGPKPGRNCRVAGWGETMGLGPNNRKLKETTVAIVSSDICRKTYYFPRTEMILCAGGEKGQDTCTGDSGGPLICESENTPGQWIVQGIISFGHRRCGTENYPATYTQISYYLFWIYTVVETECAKWRGEHYMNLT